MARKKRALRQKCETILKRRTMIRSGKNTTTISMYLNNCTNTTENNLEGQIDEVVDMDNFLSERIEKENESVAEVKW